MTYAVITKYFISASGRNNQTIRFYGNIVSYINIVMWNCLVNEYVVLI